MEPFQGILYGFGVVLTPANLMFCFLGVLMGTVVGVLPGIGPAAAISLLLPSTYRGDPVSSMIMLAGVYYGAMYGGSTTSILVNIPGEAASVVTCLDGYQMARNGRAGPALGISAFGSFIAGTLSVVGLLILAPTLASFALQFGPSEYFSLMVMSMILVTYLSRGPMLKSLMMVALGLIIGVVGMDPITAKLRFDYNLLVLRDGLGLVPVVMGLFGISEVLMNVRSTINRDVFQDKIQSLLPNLKDWKDSAFPIMRGTLLGFFMGTLPGIGAVIPTFISYGVEKKLSKHPEKFGTGIIEGVAAPEACNNAASGGSFIPMMSLGIPSSVIMAMFLGALMIHGIQPGPLLIKEQPRLFWGLIASMYLGNIMLLILNLPLIAIWVKVLKIPYSILYPLILIFCLIGAYSINNNVSDAIIMCIFGVVGYLMKIFQYEAAPLVLAIVLGPMLEENLRKALLISRGNLMVFVTRPLSMAFLLIALLVLMFPLLRLRPSAKYRDYD